MWNDDNNSHKTQPPDEFDIEIVLAAYQNKYDKNGNINKLKPFMDKVKIFHQNNINYLIFSIDIGEPNETLQSMVPIIEFLKEFNENIIQE